MPIFDILWTFIAQGRVEISSSGIATWVEVDLNTEPLGVLGPDQGQTAKDCLS